MSKKNKMEKFQEIIMDRFYDSARDDASALYDADVDAFASFIDHMFGSDIAASIMRSIESDAECLGGNAEVSIEPYYNWPEFKSLCATYGPADGTDYYRDDHFSARSGKAFAKLREVFDALNKHLKSGDITEMECYIELRTPYSCETRGISFDADDLSVVSSNLDFREFIYNGICNILDDIISSIYELLNTMNPHNNNDGDKLPLPIIDQYKEMVERLTNTTTNGIRNIHPMKSSIARQLAIDAYEDIAMLVGTLDDILYNDDKIPSNSGFTISEIGTSYSVIRLVSVRAMIKGSDCIYSNCTTPDGESVSPEVSKIFTNTNKDAVEEDNDKGETESE